MTYLNMTTPRFFDNDGLDGILPAKTVSYPSKYLIWGGSVVVILLSIIILLAFLSSSRGTIIGASAVPSKLDKISSRSTQDKAKTSSALDNKQINLNKNAALMNNHSADIQPNELNSIPVQVTEKIKSISNSNQLNGSENIALKDLKNDKVSLAVDLPNKQQDSKKNKNTVLNKGKATVIKPSKAYVFEFSFKNIEFLAANEASSLTDFIHQCDNKINIVGHTCNLGPASFNYQLGLTRAKAVQQYLISQGANPDILTISSKGMEQPIANNATKPGRILNRRVELLCIKD